MNFQKGNKVFLGYHHSDEVKKRISEKLKGRKKPTEVVEKIARANRGKKRNMPSWNKGIKTPDHIRKKISVETKKAMALPEVRTKISIANKMRSIEVNKKISDRVKALWEDKEYRSRMSEAHKGQRAWNKGVPLTSEHKKNLIIAINKLETLNLKREKSRALWMNTEYIKKIQRSLKVHPNKSETVLFDLLNVLYPEEWKFTGDFSFIINGKSPDFVNCNGKKKIIELFGDYWHRGENPEDRKKMFEPFGYKTLVVWESELQNIDEVATKVKRFCVDHI